MNEMHHSILNELDALYKFPTLLEIASKKDRMTVLMNDPTLIRYIKKPTNEEQLFVLNADINNYQYINKPSESVIKKMVKTNPLLLDIIDPVPEYLCEYVMNTSIDNMMRFYPSPVKLIKEIIYILYKRRQMQKASRKDVKEHIKP